WVATREKRRERRRGRVRLRVGPGEAQAGRGEAIDVRRRVPAVPIGTKVVGPERIDRDQKDVEASHSGRRGCPGGDNLVEARVRTGAVLIDPVARDVQAPRMYVAIAVVAVATA